MAVDDPFNQGLKLATLNDAPNAGALVLGIVEEMTKRLNMRFASASERGATITEPESGMVTWLKDAKIAQIYDGTAWQTIVAATLPWAGVTYASGFNGYGGSTVGPRVRREGSIVYLEGRLKRASGADIPASDNLTLGTVPEDYWPVGHYAEDSCTISNAGSGPPLARIEIWHTDGTIRYWSDKPTAFVGFSSMWFVN